MVIAGRSEKGKTNKPIQPWFGLHVWFQSTYTGVTLKIDDGATVVRAFVTYREREKETGDLTFSSATHAWNVSRFQKFYLREGGWRSVTKHPVKDDRIGLLQRRWGGAQTDQTRTFPGISHFLQQRRRFLRGGDLAQTVSSNLSGSHPKYMEWGVQFRSCFKIYKICLRLLIVVK